MMSYPGCPDVTRMLNVLVEPVPLVDLGADSLAKCFDAVLPVAALVQPAGFPAYTYAWRSNPGLDGTTTASVQYSGNADTMLLLTVTTPIGCRGVDSVYIDSRPRRFGGLSPRDTTVCPEVPIGLRASGGHTYRWIPGRFLSDTVSASVSSRPAAPQRYVVHVIDDIGCADTLSVSIGVHTAAAVDLPDSAILSWGQSIRMNPAATASSFVWSPSIWLDNPFIANATAAPQSSVRYVLQGATAEGCTARDSIFVFVNSAILLPNAFVPGTGVNREFRILHTGVHALRSFRIFNRWGTLVFSTTDINIGWDGSYNGQPQPAGVYVYTVDAVGMRGGPIRKQGNLTLIR